MPPCRRQRAVGLAGPLLVTAFGAFLRFNRLSMPRAVVFDETYYVGDAWASCGTASRSITSRTPTRCSSSGSTHILGPGGEFVAHPPLGKMLIAGGEWLFGLTPFGWRFSVAVVGSLAILMTARIARRMTRSTLLGCVAGLLIALDGLEFVMSRTALLDIFVMFWVLAAFGCLVIDRDRVPRAAGRRSRGGRATAAGGRRRAAARRPLVAGGGRAVPGLACASKWNGIWYIPVFGCMAIAWDTGARRAAGYAPAVAAARCGATQPGCRSPSGWCRSRRISPPGAAGSAPAPATTGTGPPSTATTRRCCPPSTRCTSTTRRCAISASR